MGAGKDKNGMTNLLPQNTDTVVQQSAHSFKPFFSVIPPLLLGQYSKTFETDFFAMYFLQFLFNRLNRHICILSMKHST